MAQFASIHHQPLSKQLEVAEVLKIQYNLNYNKEYDLVYLSLLSSAVEVGVFNVSPSPVSSRVLHIKRNHAE